MCHIARLCVHRNKFVSEPTLGPRRRVKECERVATAKEGRVGDLRASFFMYRKSEHFFSSLFFIAVFEVNHDRFMLTIYSKLD